MSGVGGVFAIKAEPEDVSLSPLSREEDASPPKRQKMMVMVVVPTLEEVDRRRRAAKLGYKEEPDVKPPLVRLNQYIDHII